MQFHAVLIGKRLEEFGVDLVAANHAEAYAILRDSYPESWVDCLETNQEAAGALTW